MDTAYIAITVLAAVAMASAATLSLVRHRLVVAAADVVELPRSWVPRLGALLGAGALGLIVGFALPVLGVVTAVALVLYFLAAVGAHIRVRDHDPGRLANVLLMPDGAASCEVERRPKVPHGTGDLLAALFLGHLLRGESGPAALGRAAAGVELTIAASAGRDELSLASLPADWASAHTSKVDVEA